MSQDGPTAADLINSASEAELADILFQYGEERASRRIARAIVAARPLTRTGELAEDHCRMPAARANRIRAIPPPAVFRRCGSR